MNKPRLKSKVIELLILSFLLVAVLEIGTVKAQEPLALTITPEGDVEPATDLLERNGTIYTFKGDIFGTIMVKINGITIDGDGYTLQGRNNIDERGIYLFGPGQYLFCEDVMIKNLRICDFSTGIFVPGASNNKIINNYFENSRIHLLGGSRNGDLIKNNVFKDTGVFVDYSKSGADRITENNFFNGWIAVGLSDVPIVYKNYWSDYNGTDSNGDGIGDTPHTSQRLLDETVQDNQPIMAPLDIEVIPEFPTWIILPVLVIAPLFVIVFKKKAFRSIQAHLPAPS
jgi:hypothetical protein